MRPPGTSTEIAATLGGIQFRGERLSLPAAGKGHDASLVEDEFVGIADGSTPLRATESIDAHGYACEALERLRQYRALEPGEMFSRALSTTGPRQGAIAQRPSSAVITLTAIAGELIVAALGDCLGVVRRSDGRLAVAWDQRLDDFDEPVAERMARDVSDGRSPEEARRAVDPQLRANRDLANREGTYWLFADDPAAAEHLATSSVRLGEVDEILLCSDGFTRLIKPFKLVGGVEDLLERARTQGLDRLGAQLRSAEEAPHSFADFPRLDISDDATAIQLKRVR